MYQFKVITTGDKSNWTSIIERTKSPDIYFTLEYLEIYSSKYSDDIDEAFCGEPILFFFGDEKDYITHVFIKRGVNILPFMKNIPKMYDIISPYGYSGPIINCESTENKEKLIKAFLKSFRLFCLENNIISEFIRFHPILKNQSYFEAYFPIDRRNDTVYLDLTQKKEDILKNMNKKTRNLIRKAEKKGIIIERVEGEDNLKKFAELYMSTMIRNNASKKYLFPESFFLNTKKFLKEDISLFVAKHEGRIVAASLFMHKYDFVHYHFSGSDKEFSSLSPNHLLIWNVILWAKDKGYKCLHLGGGLSNNDRLFHFKSGFSNTRATFYTASVIHNQKVYQELCALKDSFERGKGKEINISSFFPYYRRIMD